LSKENRYRIEAVDRALVLLDTLALFPGTTAAQLAATMGANRSLVFRMLSTLADRGFVARDANNCYRLGPRLVYLGNQAERSDALVDASREVLDRLLEETHENIYLIVRDGLEILCLAERVTPRPIRLAAGTGTHGGLHTGGGAKALLAYAPPEVINEVLDRHLHEFVPATMRTREQVLAVLSQIRRDGYYEAIGEIDDIYTLSAPVRDGFGVVTAAVVVAGPMSRLTPEFQADVLIRVREAAAEISARLGTRIGTD
jgi:DNA-binding IclR family transcriptional regulator